MSRAAGIAFALLLALGPALPTAWAKGAGGGQALQPKLEGQALVDALKQGGHVILLRHMATEPVTPDPDLFDLSDCSTQRALSEKGRSQAVLMGKAFRKLGIPFGEILSSPYCRCQETGKLAFGRATRSDILLIRRPTAGGVDLFTVVPDVSRLRWRRDHGRRRGGNEWRGVLHIFWAVRPPGARRRHVRRAGHRIGAGPLVRFPSGVGSR